MHTKRKASSLQFVSALKSEGHEIYGLICSFSCDANMSISKFLRLLWKELNIHSVPSHCVLDGWSVADRMSQGCDCSWAISVCQHTRATPLSPTHCMTGNGSHPLHWDRKLQRIYLRIPLYLLVSLNDWCGAVLRLNLSVTRISSGGTVWMGLVDVASFYPPVYMTCSLLWENYCLLNCKCFLHLQLVVMEWTMCLWNMSL